MEKINGQYSIQGIPILNICKKYETPLLASNYNSRYRPAEVLIHEGIYYLITKRETLDDLIRNQVLIEKF